MFKFLRKTALWILLAPWVLTYTGELSNQIVIAANHDTFPVMVNDAKINVHRYHLQAKAETGDDDAQVALILLDHGYLDDTHIIMTEDTHLNWLADWIDLKDATYSIGDLMLYAGDWSWQFAPYLWAFAVIGKLDERKAQ